MTELETSLTQPASYVRSSRKRACATNLLNEQLANLIRDYCVIHVERNDAEMDRACGYKRGVAGPNPIAKWRRHLKILELAALWQQAYRPSASVYTAYRQVQAAL